MLSQLGGRDGELKKNTLKMPALCPDLSGRRIDSWQTGFRSPASSTHLSMPLVTLAWPRTPRLSKSAVGCAGDAWTSDREALCSHSPLHPASSGYLLTRCQLLPSPVLARGRPGRSVKKEAIHSEQSWAAVHMARPSMDAGPCPLF